MPQPDGTPWSWEVRAEKAARSCRRVPLPPWFNNAPKGFCRWCGKAAIGARGQPVSWHPECVGLINVAKGPSCISDKLAKAQAYRCAGCRGQLMTFAHEPAVVDPMLKKAWDRTSGLPWLPESYDRRPYRLQRLDSCDGPYSPVEFLSIESSYLRAPAVGHAFCRVTPCLVPIQVDHRFPLWKVDRAQPWARLIRYWMAENLDALCVECHKAKTAAGAAERASLRRRASQASQLPLCDAV